LYPSLNDELDTSLHDDSMLLHETQRKQVPTIQSSNMLGNLANRLNNSIPTVIRHPNTSTNQIAQPLYGKAGLSTSSIPSQ
jgi:hypothetical protein